jgi:xylan 1,4-beta-xylosidase
MCGKNAPDPIAPSLVCGNNGLKDLEAVKKAAGIKSIRFHGLFNDEMGVWPTGAKQPNFLYVDMAYDAMLDRGLKPFVELSFMPGALASGTRSLLWRPIR